MAKVLKGRRTDTIKYNLNDRGRTCTGVDRSNLDVKAMINIINSKEVQQKSEVGDLKGFYGHEVRRRFGMRPAETVIIDGKTVYLEPAIRTKDIRADKSGVVSYYVEFFDNEAGEFVKRQYAANSIGFSTAVNYRMVGNQLVPVDFFGFDAVWDANYVDNAGDGQLYDGLFLPEEQEGMLACFDSATDVSQLAPSEAMLANMLEQSILREYDSIHAQMGLIQIHENALDQINALSQQLSRKEEREQLQSQRQEDLYSGMVGEIRSFDSACEEARKLLEQADQYRNPKQKQSQAIQPKPRRRFGIF